MSRFDSFFGFSPPRPPHCIPMIPGGKVILRCNDDYNATVTLMMMIMIIATLAVVMVMIKLMIIIIITIGRLAIGLMMPSLVGELSLGGSSLIGHLDQEFHHHRNFVIVIITVTIIIRGESEPGRLVLDNVNPSDAGIYKCRVDFRSLNLQKDF